MDKNFDAGNVRQIALAVEEKFESISKIVRACEEHSGTYVTKASLRRPTPTIDTIVRKMRAVGRQYDDEQLRAIVREQQGALFDEAIQLCGDTIAKKINQVAALRRLYTRQVMKDRKLRTIFYKAPNEVQIDHRFSHVVSEIEKLSRDRPQDILIDDWGVYFDRFEALFMEIDEINESMANVLERAEKYRDDKRRLWVALFALALALVVQAAWPGLKSLPWSGWYDTVASHIWSYPTEPIWHVQSD